jgi:hypothetical protein
MYNYLENENIILKFFLLERVETGDAGTLGVNRIYFIITKLLSLISALVLVTVVSIDQCDIK